MRDRAYALVCLLGIWATELSADVYTGIAALRDSLRAWETAPPRPKSADEEVAFLERAFPGAVIDSLGPGRLHVGLPPLWREQFAAGLLVEYAPVGYGYTVEAEIVDSLYVLDGRVVEGVSIHAEDEHMRDYVRARLVDFRTLAVPGIVLSDTAGQTTVDVTLVGRDIDHFSFGLNSWWRSLQYLAEGMQVYAFPLHITRDMESALVEWAIFLRSPNETSQHLLTVREWVALDTDFALKQVQVRIIPGMRMDNMDELFGRDEPRMAGSRWKVLINGDQK